ncbi:hypothetical protein CHS0354_034670 [Potamilus streckersoni]|uniref:Uncharacterized protein n=1 Tax=Potamilus streckersoni TaxID=2493646 RepID=A0AAE0WB16_9BIVA|nr:hypothetical protein CHS0354_034670 [Potamilus streckersoni]
MIRNVIRKFTQLCASRVTMRIISLQCAFFLFLGGVTAFLFNDGPTSSSPHLSEQFEAPLRIGSMNVQVFGKTKIHVPVVRHWLPKKCEVDIVIGVVDFEDDDVADDAADDVANGVVDGEDNSVVEYSLCLKHSVVITNKKPKSSKMTFPNLFYLRIKKSYRDENKTITDDGLLPQRAESLLKSGRSYVLLIGLI